MMNLYPGPSLYKPCLHGAVVGRLNPVQEVTCPNHDRVTSSFWSRSIQPIRYLINVGNMNANLRNSYDVSTKELIGNLAMINREDV